MRCLTIALCLLACGHALSAQPCACCDSVYRQFDFWAGDWNVYDTSGSLVGTNSISVQQDSCLLQENWRSVGVHRGTSYNFYDARTKKWNQTWVDITGYVLQMEGGLDGNAMVLRSEDRTQDEQQFYHEISWTPNEEGNVRQLWVIRDPEGEALQTVFDGLYKKQ